jgi:hypothetical protein
MLAEGQDVTINILMIKMCCLWFSKKRSIKTVLGIFLKKIDI